MNDADKISTLERKNRILFHDNERLRSLLGEIWLGYRNIISTSMKERIMYEASISPLHNDDE